LSSLAVSQVAKKVLPAQQAILKILRSSQVGEREGEDPLLVLLPSSADRRRGGNKRGVTVTTVMLGV
jgi:hypothetical protein